jgi:APA family basic amino acid/polyamine antiporter
MIVMGGMIGSGIFIVSADIARNVGSAGMLLLVWGLTALLTVVAAVSYGELAGMFPRAGGQYVYLREAFNPLVAFLFGWAFFAVVQTGTIAAVGVAFAKFAAYLIPGLSEKNYLLDLGAFRISAAQVVSIVMIVFLTWVNSRGIQNGKWIQRIFTLSKTGALLGIVLLGFILGFRAEIWQANWADAWNAEKWLAAPTGTFSVVAITSAWALAAAVAVSMVGSLFSSDAWNNVTFVAGEIKNPQRNIGLALFIGTLTVCSLYMLTNLMYTATLSMQDIAFAADDRVGIAAAKTFLGEAGVVVIAILIMVSTFGCNNGLILSGARVYYTMAQDGLFFPKAGELNRFAVPGYALWAQGIWACLLCLTGRYGDLLDYVIFAVLIFYILTMLGIFRLRATRPDAERPYRAFGYPVVPAMYILLAGFICLMLLVYKPNYTWPGLGIVLLGVPVYYFVLRKRGELKE